MAAHARLPAAPSLPARAAHRRRVAAGRLRLARIQGDLARPARRARAVQGERPAGILPRRGVDDDGHPRPARRSARPAARPRAGARRRREHAAHRRHHDLRVRRVLPPVRRAGHPRVAGLHVRQHGLPGGRSRVPRRDRGGGAPHPRAPAPPPLHRRLLRRQRDRAAGRDARPAGRRVEQPVLRRGAAAALLERACRDPVFSLHALGRSTALPCEHRHLALLRRGRLSPPALGREERAGEVHHRVPGVLQRARGEDDGDGVRR